MDSIRLSVRELVEFNYQSGDLETNKHSTNRALEGILAHKILQESMGDKYKKEFYLKREFYLDIEQSGESEMQYLSMIWNSKVPLSATKYYNSGKKNI